jgi:hypothetical protein
LELGDFLVIRVWAVAWDVPGRTGVFPGVPPCSRKELLKKRTHRIRTNSVRSRNHPIGQGPAPPQRAHISEDGDEPPPLDCSAPTANTLRFRAVFADPHFGQETLASSPAPLMWRTSFSNFASQDLHVYS